MREILYELQLPSSGRAGESFAELKGRDCSVTCHWHSSEGQNVPNWIEFAFYGVEAYKYTYYKAVSDHALEAYDQLVNIRLSNWLEEIKTNLRAHDENVDALKHLGIYFDDGPFYEFICKRYRLTEENRS